MHSKGSNSCFLKYKALGSGISIILCFFYLLERSISRIWYAEKQISCMLKSDRNHVLSYTNADKIHTDCCCMLNVCRTPMSFAIETAYRYLKIIFFLQTKQRMPLAFILLDQDPNLWSSAFFLKWKNYIKASMRFLWTIVCW